MLEHTLQHLFDRNIPSIKLMDFVLNGWHEFCFSRDKQGKLTPSNSFFLRLISVSNQRIFQMNWRNESRNLLLIISAHKYLNLWCAQSVCLPGLSSLIGWRVRFGLRTWLAINHHYRFVSRGRSVFGHNFQNRFNYKAAPPTAAAFRSVKKERKMTALPSLFTLPLTRLLLYCFFSFAQAAAYLDAFCAQCF